MEPIRHTPTAGMLDIHSSIDFAYTPEDEQYVRYLDYAALERRLAETEAERDRLRHTIDAIQAGRVEQERIMREDTGRIRDLEARNKRLAAALRRLRVWHNADTDWAVHIIDTALRESEAPQDEDEFGPVSESELDGARAPITNADAEPPYTDDTEPPTETWEYIFGMATCPSGTDPVDAAEMTGHALLELRQRIEALEGHKHIYHMPLGDSVPSQTGPPVKEDDDGK